MIDILVAVANYQDAARKLSRLLGKPTNEDLLIVDLAEELDDLGEACDTPYDL